MILSDLIKNDNDVSFKAGGYLKSTAFLNWKTLKKSCKTIYKLPKKWYNEIPINK